MKVDPIIQQETLKQTKEIAIPLQKCNIVIAHGGDPGSGFATMIYTYGINLFLYAEQYNMTLWIDYNKDYIGTKLIDPIMDENLWNYYLNPVTPENQGCNLNISNITILDKKYVFPYLHYSEPWAIHGWYYYFKYDLNNVPKWIRKNIEYDRYYPDWYFSQRSTGYYIVSKYFKYKSYFINNVNNIWISLFGNESNNYEILGVHMRGTDKAAGRRKVLPFEYLPYINKFVKYYGNKSKIFIATDDKNYLIWIKSNVAINQTIYTQSNVERSELNLAIFELKHVSKYKIGMEVLTDILLLSKCDWLIHSASAVSESVFYTNIKLHNKSVNLEYTRDRQQPIWWLH